MPVRRVGVDRFTVKSGPFVYTVLADAPAGTPAGSTLAGDGACCPTSVGSSPRMSEHGVPLAALEARATGACC